MKRSARLVVPAFAMLGMAASAVMTSCSSGSEAQSLTTVTIGPQSYSQREPATTTTTIAIEDAEPGDVIHEEQEYTVQPNDGLSLIANLYEITAEELAAYNGWADGVSHPINPGETIRIPPGAIYVDDEMLSAATSSVAPPASDEDDPVPSTTGTVGTDRATPPPTSAASGGGADGEEACVAGTYVVQANDSTRLAVAERFDVTVQALDEINADTPGYSGFYPGLEILIPDSSDC